MDSDSDFYGDEETVSRLLKRVDSVDMKDWWEDSAYVNAAAPSRQENKVSLPRPELYNCYAGRPNAWQLEESVDTFLSRLPPETTVVGEQIPWILIGNPHRRLDGGTGSQADPTLRLSDEGPNDSECRLGRFMAGGMERLHLLAAFMERARGNQVASAVIETELAAEKEAAQRDILRLAHMLHVRCGKWMLFIRPKDVNAVWATVARATADGQLGVAAKVAPYNPGTPYRDRLICIYTADFWDMDDIGKVLTNMKALNLFPPGPKQLYYKAGQLRKLHTFLSSCVDLLTSLDAYTYLGIDSGNKWTFKASLYSSNEIMSYIVGKEPASI